MRCSSFVLASVCCGATLALAHGESTPADLRQTRLCLDSSSVRVQFESMTTEAQLAVRPRLERSLRGALIRGLQRENVVRVAAASCVERDAHVQLTASVRYLDPKQYKGFGDPAYSYGVQLTVFRLKSPGAPSTPRFAAGTSDIHSEGNTKKKFEVVVSAWGAELAEDLSAAWRQANPGAPRATVRKP